MRNYIYKHMLDGVTDICYKNTFRYLPTGSRILDVGIGNGIMIQQYHELIKAKDLKITGLDINRDYLRHCRSLIRRWKLEENMEVHHTPVEKYIPPDHSYFDYILFSMSFMLFNDQRLVLGRIKPWLKPQGEVIFFQTMFKDRSFLLDVIKPRLKYVTSVDFGRVTYEKDFYALLDSTDISVTKDLLLKKEWFKGEYRLIISSPRDGKGRIPLSV